MASSKELWGVVFSSLVLGAAGCGGAVDGDSSRPRGNVESEIIAGVSASGTSINAIGALVEVYRYTTCDPRLCPSGGIGGGSVIDPIVIPPPPLAIPESSGMGYFDNPSWLAGRAHARGDAGAGGSNTPPPPGRGGSAGVAGRDGGVGGVDGGSLVEVVEYWPFCSATLVGPTAVLSAKHCLEDLRYMREVAFAVGPVASKPTAVYPIVDAEVEGSVPSDSRLWGNGSDVGVVHLETPVAGVTPFAVGTLDPGADVGSRFTVVGYGEQNTDYESGTRKAGSLTLRSIGGNYADYAFGGFEGLKEKASELRIGATSEDELWRYYERMALLDEYQAFLGGQPGDAQPCYGDSGGPVVAVRDGVRTTFGVVTGGIGSNRLQCDWGGVFAVFGPAAKSFIDRALRWVDPCTGVTVAGRCEGDAAIRCTAPNEGKRRVSITDCALLGQTCGPDEQGRASCLDL